VAVTWWPATAGGNCNTVRLLDLTQPGVASRVLRLQRRAYRREARLIGYRRIPALREKASDLLHSGESFLLCYQGRRLAGLLSWKHDGRRAEICRLLVDPRYWRRGLAGELLAALEAREAGELRVATAAANAPALAFYRKHGFRPLRSWRTPDGLELRSLFRPGSVAW
jgi:ribosomal protein S18 acetylase RimI-like enzyme